MCYARGFLIAAGLLLSVELQQLLLLEIFWMTKHFSAFSILISNFSCRISDPDVRSHLLTSASMAWKKDRVVCSRGAYSHVISCDGGQR